MNPKVLAIYLPQFHPIPENDKAWGDGFTEWTNVKKAQPEFEGHYQPHVPHADVGYYDLRDIDVLKKQAKMAGKYGIYGFAYYHYWFNGKRLLNLPLDNMLKSSEPDFPFCYIWANEPWSKRWDGSENDIIQGQNYSPEDDLNHIRYLCENVFPDKRYIKINGKPLFFVYRTELLPDACKTAGRWRNEVKKYGFEDIYLGRVENFISGIIPQSINFDAALEFAPDRKELSLYKHHYENETLLYTSFSYQETVANMIAKEYDYKVFRSVFPSWDNTPRKKNNITVYEGETPRLFAYFLSDRLKYTRKNFSKEESFVFINAWNEWGEGCHIEPDKKNGYAYLEAVRETLYTEQIDPPVEYSHFLEKDRYRLLQEKNKLSNEHKSRYYKVGKKIVSPLQKIKKKFLK